MKMNRNLLVREILLRASDIANGKQFGPAGGQCKTDATDFRYIAQLIKEERDTKAKRMIYDLDTASRDALPDKVLDWAGFENLQS
jgi:hypothetical protein